VDITFPATGDAATTTILNYDLQAYVPVTVTGAVPVKSIDNRADMTVEVVWKDAGGADITGRLTAFAQGADYKAVITLEAKPELLL
jgi:hypothetical protein